MKIRNIIKSQNLIFVYIFFWAVFLLRTIPQNQYISFDESFHGGAALFYFHLIRRIFSPAFSFDFMEYRWQWGAGLCAYPPLWTLLTGLSYLVFGLSHLSPRLVTVLFGAGTLYLTFLIANRYYDRKTALLSVIFLSFLPPFFIYSRRIMLEVPLAFGVIFALYFLFQLYNKDGLKDKKLLILTLVAISLGIMVKVVGIGVILLSFILFLCLSALSKWSIAPFKRALKPDILLVVFSAIILFIAWLKIQDYFLKFNPIDLYASQQVNETKFLKETIEAPSFLIILKSLFITFWQSRGWYLNLWFTSLWLGYLFVAGIILAILRRKDIDILLISIVLGVYFVFTALATKGPHYVMPYFIPLVILASNLIIQIASVLDRGISFSFWPRLRIVVACLFLIILFWNLRYAYRRDISIGWDARTTGLHTVIKDVIRIAKPREKVLISDDSNKYLFHLYDQEKHLELIPGMGVFLPPEKALEIAQQEADFVVVQTKTDHQTPPSVREYLEKSAQFELISEAFGQNFYGEKGISNYIQAYRRIK